MLNESSVDDFATKVGAKLFWPEEDLKVDEKREMTKIVTSLFFE